jgi:hypothetical protein
MLRAAIVAPEEHMRRVLVEVADSGTFEPDPSLTGPVSSIDALVDRATSLHPDASPLLSLSRVEVDGLATDADFSVLLGEAELEQRTEALLTSGVASSSPDGSPPAIFGPSEN